MAAYRADIEIGVRGARSLEQLRSSINQTAQAVDSLNEVVSARGSLVQNIQNYTNNLDRAARSLRLVGAGTEAETKAVREYVRALGEANTARARQNSLIAQEVANQRRINPQTAPYGQQGPSLPPALVRSQQIQQNWNRFFQEAAQVGQELQTTAAAKTVNIKTSWNRFFQEAADLAVELTIQAQRTSAAIRSKEGAASAAARQRLTAAAEQRQRIQNAGFGMQGPALPPTAGGTTRGNLGIGGRLGGAISGGIIGGAFPLLFGQSGGASAGGAIGGVIGGLAGGQGGSFAGGLLGTLLGDIASRGQAVKQLGEDLGFSAQQTKQLAAAFKIANTDVEKFTAVIQNIRGVGLELEDQAKAIQLVTRLTDVYGGSFEKTGNAITSALESGKVSQATLNQLTSQGINVQDALAKKYDVSRSAILQMAKDGEISVQTLIDTLVKMGNEGEKAATKPKTAMERLKESTDNLNAAVSSLVANLVKSFGPAFQWLTDRVTDFINAVSRAISRVADLMSGGRMAQAEIQSARAAENATRNKFGIFGGIRAFNPAAQKFYEQQKQAELKRLVPGAFAPSVKATPLESFRAPSEFGPTGAGAKKASDKAAKDAERLAEQRQKQLEIAARLAVETDNELNISYALTAQEKLQYEYDLKRMERMTKYETLYKDALSNAELEYLVIAQINESRTATNELTKEQTKFLQAQNEELYAQLGVSELLNSTNQKRFQGAFGTSMGAAGFRTDINLNPYDKAAQQLNTYKTELDKLTEATYLAQTGADGIAEAFSGAFESLVTGATTAQQALATFFSGVGKAFVSMATEIIAKMIVMFAFKQLLGLFGGRGGGLFSGAGPVAMPSAGVGGGSSMFMPGAPSFLAEGGFVTGPTRAVIGEGGQPEYVIPASKMRGAMQRYAGGARGAAVISGSDQAAGADGGMAAVGPIDVRYSVERINSVDYVTADQFQRGMQQAASQGAQRGEQRALRSLQQSTAVRSRVGMR